MNGKKSNIYTSVFRSIGALLLVFVLSLPTILHDLQSVCDHDHGANSQSDSQYYEACDDCDVIALQLLPFVLSNDNPAVPEGVRIDHQPSFSEFDFRPLKIYGVTTNRGPPAFTLC
jgi:hypothetical protein